MEQKQTFKTELEQISERSLGNYFEEFLTEKNMLQEFDKKSKIYGVVIDGVQLRISEGLLTLKAIGYPATIKQALKFVIKPDQKLKFLPAVAGG